MVISFAPIIKSHLVTDKVIKSLINDPLALS